MNPASHTARPPTRDASTTAQEFATSPPMGWLESLLTLVSSRIALIELESKELAQHSLRRVGGLVMVVFCVFFMWALLLAGGIALLSLTMGWPWYWVAIGLGGGHLLAALLLITAVKSPTPASFPVTRAEFHKDREWIKKFQTTRKSNG